jgi:hypothetical protein
LSKGWFDVLRFSDGTLTSRKGGCYGERDVVEIGAGLREQSAIACRHGGDLEEVGAGLQRRHDDVEFLVAVVKDGAVGNLGAVVACVNEVDAHAGVGAYYLDLVAGYLEAAVRGEELVAKDVLDVLNVDAGEGFGVLGTNVPLPRAVSLIP